MRLVWLCSLLAASAAASAIRLPTRDDALDLGSPVDQLRLAVTDKLNIDNVNVPAAAEAVVDSVWPHLPVPPHHPPPVIDLSHLTILEIINASLHHHDHDKHHKMTGGSDGPPPADPSHLPLHRLAWLVNASTQAQQALDRKSQSNNVPFKKAPENN